MEGENILVKGSSTEARNTNTFYACVQNNSKARFKRPYSQLKHQQKPTDNASVFKPPKRLQKKLPRNLKVCHFSQTPVR